MLLQCPVYMRNNSIFGKSCKVLIIRTRLTAVVHGKMVAIAKDGSRLLQDVYRTLVNKKKSLWRVRCVWYEVNRSVS